MSSEEERHTEGGCHVVTEAETGEVLPQAAECWRPEMGSPVKDSLSASGDLPRDSQVWTSGLRNWESINFMSEVPSVEIGHNHPRQVHGIAVRRLRCIAMTRIRPFDIDVNIQPPQSPSPAPPERPLVL